MKYPQLVSPRAVNAISDWLVARLEQMGVEAPQLYTRLLLSLLQTSVLLNDPNDEFTKNLQSLIVNNRRGGRRYCVPNDTDTLKKLSAVQCLREIVSSDQEMGAIEQLVDELCDKLQRIEQQSTDGGSARCGDDERLAAGQVRANIQQHQHRGLRSDVSQQPQARAASEGACSTTAAPADATKAVLDTETDPKKRYFRAFPALSKEMEDSFRIWRQNAKLLTWPVDRSKLGIGGATARCKALANGRATLNHVDSAQADIAGDGNDASVVRHEIDNMRRNMKSVDDGFSDVSVSGHADGGASGDGTVKRKSKRRRNQAISKGKLTQNTRKGSMSGGMGRCRSPPTCWDTDFEGCWEMGPDLIKDFLSKQNSRAGPVGGGGYRNRSTSESAAVLGARAVLPHDSCGVGIPKKLEVTPNVVSDLDSAENIACIPDSGAEGFWRPAAEQAEVGSSCHDLSNEECCSDGASERADDLEFEYDNTLAAVAELPEDFVLQASLLSAPARRLYEREVKSSYSTAGADCESHSGDELLDDFAQFKAKFNSSVEALWRDKSCGIGSETGMLLPDVFASFHAATNASLPACVSATMSYPNNDDSWIHDFWTNYYQHHLDVSQMKLFGYKAPQHQKVEQTASLVGDCSGFCQPFVNPSDCNESVHKCSNGGVGHNTSDYFSMPTTLEISQTTRDEATPTTPYDQSIWSDGVIGINGGGGHQSFPSDTDEGFYLKVWHSNQQLNHQLDSLVECGEQKLREVGMEAPVHASVDDNISARGPLVFAGSSSASSTLSSSYGTSKWSEGINVGPHVTLQMQSAQPSLSLLPGVVGSAGNTIGASLKRDNSNVSSIDCPTDGSSTTGGSCPTANSGVSISASSMSCSSNAGVGATGGPALAARASLGSYVHGVATATAWQTTAVFDEARLQTDLQSWSTSDPLSLTEMYISIGGGGSAIDALDVVVSESSERSSAIQDETLVTLPNHSPQTSGFVTYARLNTNTVQVPSPTACLLSSNTGNAEAGGTTASSVITTNSRDDDNLLTSERTHFHPIKTYADGHTFEICSALDAVAYERSNSGYWHLEHERYLEYTRHDGYLAEEDAATGCNAPSAAPLYASSNCEAATKMTAVASGVDKKSACERLVLKFRLQNTDIACQTDESPPELTTSGVVEKHNPYLVIFSATSASNLPTSIDDCNSTRKHMCKGAIEALNKAVVAAATAAAASIWQTTTDASICGDGSEEVDFWSSISTSCSSTTAVAATALRKTLAVDDGNAVGKHCIGDNLPPEARWWDAFAASSTDAELMLQSAPADQRLCAELQRDGDEIMSDLRYMQDLYIDADDDEADGQTPDDDETGCAIAALQKVRAHPPDDVREDSSGPGAAWPSSELWQWYAKNGFKDEVQAPKNRERTGDATDECRPAGCPTTCGGTHNDGNHSMDMPAVVQESIRVCEEVLRAEDEAFLSQLTWEHTNLAQIWQQSTPPIPLASHPLPASRFFNPIAQASQREESTVSPADCAVTEEADAFRKNSLGAQVVESDIAEGDSSFTSGNVSDAAGREVATAQVSAASATMLANPITDVTMRHRIHSLFETKIARKGEVVETLAAASKNAPRTNAFVRSTTTRKRRHSASQNYFGHYHPHLHYYQNAHHQRLVHPTVTTHLCSSSNNNNNNNNNNNSIDVADLNSCCLNWKVSNTASTTADDDRSATARSLLLLDDGEVQKLIKNSALLRQALKAHQLEKVRTAMNHNNNCDDGAMVRENNTRQQQAVITCNYWTTSEAIDDDGRTGIDTTELGSGTPALSTCVIDKNASILRHVTMLARPLTR